MRSLALAAALVLLSSSAALADDPADKAAHFARTDAGKLDEVRGFTLPGVRGYTHAVFSREPRETAPSTCPTPSIAPWSSGPLPPLKRVWS